MADRAGAAKRRRERRLRSWLRHERMTVAAELSAALHHSRGGGREQYVGLRAQKSDSSAVVEEVEYEPHYALQGQKTPPPGERPAPLSEVAGPQRSDRTARHSAGEAPLLVVWSWCRSLWRTTTRPRGTSSKRPSCGRRRRREAGGGGCLARCPDPAPDAGTTVSFLLAENLELQKEEEKERRRKWEEAEHEARMRELDRRVMADEQLNPAESYAWRKWRGFLPSEPRRKKKRKKKNFLVLLGLDKVVDVPVIFSDKFLLFEVPQFQFIDRVVDIPVL